MNGSPDEDHARPSNGAKSPTLYRVLVADDKHTLAAGLAAALRDLGHEVVGQSPDGEDAIIKARDHKPDLALLDIRMPKVEGIEVALLIWAELRIPSVIISAFSDEDYLGRIRSNGADSGVFGYLLKPVSQDELRVTIGVAMQQAALVKAQSGRISQLEQTLSNRKVNERAKWILVASLKITEAEAHEKLQRAARDRRKPLVEIAQAVIDTGKLPE